MMVGGVAMAIVNATVIAMAGTQPSMAKSTKTQFFSGHDGHGKFSRDQSDKYMGKYESTQGK